MLIIYLMLGKSLLLGTIDKRKVAFFIVVRVQRRLKLFAINTSQLYTEALFLVCLAQ